MQEHLILKYRVKIEINIIMDLNAEYINISNKISLKNKRNLILNETDKYMMPDYPLSPEQLIIAKEYRQALRDFTNNNYILPDKPDFVS